MYHSQFQKTKENGVIDKRFGTRLMIQNRIAVWELEDIIEMGNVVRTGR